MGVVIYFAANGGVEKADIVKKQKMAHISPESEKVIFMNHRSKKIF